MAKAGPDKGIKTACTNKKARRDYQIEEVIEAGLVLWGNEVKSLRDGRANLTDAYAKFSGGEVWLTGLHITPYSHTRIEEQDPTRERKLLLHAREIRKLGQKVKERGYTLVPLKIYFKRGIAKVELGLGKGKKFYDKREDMKTRDAKREMDRQAASRG
ncbi:MAG: SsrA-binding protein [Deltaproteobacteria bacterium]|nr:MAG: SsrA-binding protein [Deltaproteobacteria bacterium]